MECNLLERDCISDENPLRIFHPNIVVYYIECFSTEPGFTKR